MTTFEEEKRAFMEFFHCGDKFLEREEPFPDDPDDAVKTGVDRILFSTFPVEDFHGTVSLIYMMHDIRIYSAEKDIEAQIENGEYKKIKDYQKSSQIKLKELLKIYWDRDGYKSKDPKKLKYKNCLRNFNT